MKYILFLTLICASALHAEVTPSMRDEFLSRLKATSQSREKDRYLMLFCADGLSPEMLKLAETAIEYNLAEIKKYGDAVTFTWSAPSPDMLKIPEANGIRYTPNLHAEEILAISWHDTIRDNDVKSSFNLGVKNGRLLIIGTIKKSINQGN